jgi:hypothetical protein
VERGVKRKLAIGATGLAVLGGAGVAYGVTQSGSNERQAFLGDVAKRLNVTPDRLKAALKGAFEDRLDAAVKAGRLTQAQADEIKRRVEQNGGPPIFGGGPGPGRGFFFHHRWGGPVKAGLDAAAKYLGLSDAQLIAKLRSGKSLADVAGEQSKSVAGLKTAIRNSVKGNLDAAVKDKRITQAQEDRILSALDSRLDHLVNRKGLGPGPRFRHRAWGAMRGERHFRFGAAPAGGPPAWVPII